MKSSIIPSNGGIRDYIIVATLALICNVSTLFGTFVFDDVEAILKNHDVRLASPLLQTFKNDFWGTSITSNLSHKSYRPLTTITYRLDAWFSGTKLNAFYFHLTNLFLYAVLCGLTLYTLKVLCKRNKLLKDDTAFLTCLLFTLHPIHTEVVAGLVGRADLLGSILFLLTLLLYGKTVKNASYFHFTVVLFLTLAATLCKETAITVLAVCCIYELFYTKSGRNILSLQWKGCENSCFRVFGLILAAFVILFLRLKAMDFQTPTFTTLDNPAAFSNQTFTKIMTYNYIYFLNVVLLVWPQWLCFDWSMGCIPLIEEFCDSRLVFVFVFWAAIALLLYRLVVLFMEKKFRIISPIIMGVSFMVFPFIPASNLFMKVGFVIAERILLLPSLGFCFLVTLGFKTLTRRYKQNVNFLYAMFYTLCVILAVRTIERNSEWLSEDKLFKSALNVCPLNAKVHYNIAKVTADQNDKNLAIAEYYRAIELNPNYEQAMNNLANLLRDGQQYHEAQVLLRKALSIRPNFAAAWMNLGIVLSHLNKPVEAEECYLTAITHRTKYPDCYYNLGNLYLDQKRNREALKAWEKSVEYNPNHKAAWSNMLVLLDSLQQYDKVLEIGRQALKYNPTAATLHFSLGNTLGKIQKYETAEKHFLEAVNLNPTNALYYSNLGVLYHRWHKTERALEMYRKALQIDSSLKTTESNLRKLMNVT